MAAYYTDGETLNSPENLLLDETRQQLRIIGNEQDSQLLGYLRLATELIERYIWRNLFERLVTARYSKPQQSRAFGVDVLDFRKTPLNELVSIELAGKVSPLALTGRILPVENAYEIFIDDAPLGYENFIPSPYTDYPITVVANVGYKVIDGKWQAPAALQQAVIALAVYMHENPAICGIGGCNCAGNSSNGVNLPATVTAMLTTYVIRRFDGYLY